MPAAVIGTVGTRIDGVDVRTALTTPEAPDLHALFAVMRERGVDGCAMEVSSHALVMGRVDGVVFDVAAFTNLGRDHLDFHADVEDYFAAKASLFTPERARLGLVNVDDEYGRRLVDEATDPGADVLRGRRRRPTGGRVDVALEPTGSTFTVRGPRRRAGSARARAADRRLQRRQRAVRARRARRGRLRPRGGRRGGIATSGGVPGRLEQVDAGQAFLAVVDYAHKPDAVDRRPAARCGR